MKIIPRNPLNRTKRYLEGEKSRAVSLTLSFSASHVPSFLEHTVHNRIHQGALSACRLLNFCFFADGCFSFLPVFHLLPVKAAEGT